MCERIFVVPTVGGPRRIIRVNLKGSMSMEYDMRHRGAYAGRCTRPWAFDILLRWEMSQMEGDLCGPGGRTAIGFGGRKRVGSTSRHG